MTTTDVDNWPADANGVLGPDLMTRFEEHAKRFNTQIIFDQIHTVEFNNKPFKLIGDSDTYTADAVIISTGASAKYLGLDSETAFMGKGVSACATCDGFFYKNQDVAVIESIEPSVFTVSVAFALTPGGPNTTVVFLPYPIPEFVRTIEEIPSVSLNTIE